MPALAGEGLEAPMNSEKSGLGWQEGRREVAARGGKGPVKGVAGGGAVGGFGVDFE